MRINERDKVFVASGIKLAIFTVVSLIVTGYLVVVMGKIGLADRVGYRAEFVSASMIESGDPVKIGGVDVGQVTEVEIKDRTRAMVTFDLDKTVDLTSDSRAEIRYLNVIGDRYLALEQPSGTSGTSKSLDPGSTIAIDHTSPALDLTALFDGFQPLFEALEPSEVNKLTSNLIAIMQGEGGTVRQLLSRTASLTTTLADRDQLIGEVVTNLRGTLETLDSRQGQLDSLLTELNRWMAALAEDRDVIGSSLGGINQLTTVLSDLIGDARPLLKDDIAQLRKLAAQLNQPDNRKVLSALLARLPETLTDQVRTGTYGSWYNYYFCGFQLSLTFPDALVKNFPIIKALGKVLTNIKLSSTAARCEGKTP